jgi:putative SbcD/Mre11-related phosphoesterase
MMLRKGIEIIDGLPVLYIKPLSAIVCTDLHLGYEGVVADRGTFLPKVNLKNIKEILKKAVEKTGAEQIIVDGDIKNEFSKVHVEEFNEFREFVNYLRKELKIKKIILIKGNHDNFIDQLKRPLDIVVYGQEALISDFLFFHGEELPKNKEGSTLIMGHIHPAITLYNNLGIKEKLRCFLYGKMKDKREIIVVPAMNYFAEGVGVNMENVKEMAPVFKKMLDIDRMKAFCIGEGETFDYGEVGKLRKLNIY